MDKTTLVRLLHLYPVDAVRDHWQDIKATSKDSVIDAIVASAKQSEIFSFAREKQGLTKQRVILFDNVGDTLKGFGQPLLGEENAEPMFVDRGTKRLDEFYLIPIKYSAIIGPPLREEEFEFVWPVRITVERARVRITVTIIEKNLKPYLPENTNSYRVNKNIDEATIETWLVGSCEEPGMVARTDINKGVKALWAADKIDCHHSRFKGTASTKTDDMDKKKLMKRDDPATYKEAMKAPLLRTVFETIAADGFPPLFATTPCDGEISVTRYGRQIDEMDNVVTAILRAN